MSSRAFLNLRHGVPRRLDAFQRGLKRVGYKPVIGMPDRPSRKDILVTWNRIGVLEQWASKFESHDMKVLVAENASWGNEFAGDQWYHIAATHHNTTGRFPVGGAERWDRLGVSLEPFRVGSGETVILPQRGIGSDPVRMPRMWPKKMQAKTGFRVRKHPGMRQAVALQHDLRGCSRVITWGSGAAIKALMWGIKVESHMPNWIGEQDNTEEGRLRMFRELAWAQWRIEEISDGEPFARLLA